MTVGELIKLLEVVPQDATATIIVAAEHRYSEDTWGEERRQFDVSQVYDFESRVVIEGANGEWQ